MKEMIFDIVQFSGLILSLYFIFRSGTQRRTLTKLFLLIFSLVFLFGHFLTTNDEHITKEDIFAKQLSLILTLGFFFLGIVFFHQKVGGSSSLKKKEYDIRIKPLTLLVVISILIISLGLFKYGGWNSISLISEGLDNLTPQDYKELRFNQGVTGWIEEPYKYLITSIGRLLPFLLFGYGHKYKRLVYKTIAIILIVLFFLSQAALLHKSTAFFYLIQILVFYSTLYNVKVNFKNLTFIAIPPIALIGVLYTYLSGTSTIDSFFDEITYRIFQEPNRVLNEYFHWWPNHLPHKLGANIRLIHKIFGSGEFEPAFKTVIYQNINTIGMSLVGTWPTIFIADAWVDFSYLGIIVQSFLLGFILSFLDRMIEVLNGYVGISLLSTLVLSVVICTENSLISALGAGGLLALPILTVFLLRKKILVNQT